MHALIFVCCGSIPPLIFSFTKNVKQTIGIDIPFDPLLKHHVIFEKNNGQKNKKVTVKWNHALIGHCAIARLWT